MSKEVKVSSSSAEYEAQQSNPAATVVYMIAAYAVSGAAGFMGVSWLSSQLKTPFFSLTSLLADLSDVFLIVPMTLSLGV